MSTFFKSIPILFTIIWASSGFAYPSRFEPMEPKNIEPFNFFDEHKKAHTLEEFKGKIVILSYWSTRCSPCIKEMPSLDRLASKFSDVVVLNLCRDKKESTDIQKVFDQHNIKNLKVWIDLERSGPLIFHSTGTPTTYVISKEGKLLGRYVGAAEWDSQAMLDLVETYRKGEFPVLPKNLWERFLMLFKG